MKSQFLKEEMICVTELNDEGRSINLALSNRGIRALEEVGLASEVKKITIANAWQNDAWTWTEH